MSLSPELISRIIELAVPPALFSFSEDRPKNLCAFALVNSTWAAASQRILFRDATIRSEGAGPRLSTLFRLLESNSDRFSTHHLRVHGSQIGTTARVELPVVGTCLAASLRRMSLSVMTLDSDIISGLSLLEELAIQRVIFRLSSKSNPSSSSAPHTTPPSRLTDLSLSSLESALPSSLLPDALPNLKRLALSFCPAKIATDGEYSFDALVDLQSRLQFASYITGDSQFLSGDLSSIADNTLFDLSDEVIYTDLEEFEYLEASPEVRHLRINAWDGLGADGASLASWEVDALQAMLHFIFPLLETLVVPEKWKESPLYEEFLAMISYRKLLVLYEDNGDPTMGETLISPVFRKHRERTIAVANR